MQHDEAGEPSVALEEAAPQHGLPIEDRYRADAEHEGYLVRVRVRVRVGARVGVRVRGQG